MHQHHLTLLSATRKNILQLTEGLSNAQLNHIPKGFNNNLIWNMGHIVVTQELLVYRLSNKRGNISDEWISAFRKGTKPESNVSAEMIDAIRSSFFTTIDDLEKDFQADNFKEYKAYTTSYGATLNSTEDALIFNNLHESMHLGFMIALKKCL